MQLRAHSPLILVLALMAGCIEPEWRSVIDLSTTWSDDDSKLLVVIERYEARDGDGATIGYGAAMRNLTREHRVLNLDGETERDFDARTGLEVWNQLMLAEGYIFSYVSPGAGGHHRNELRWLDSGEVTVFDDEAPLLPSPDGREIARLKIRVAGVLTGDEQRYTVEFIEVPTMDVRRFHDFGLPFDRAHSFANIAWASNDELVVYVPSSAVAISRATGETRTLAMPPACPGFDANTSSSPWAEDGRTAEATLEGDVVRIEIHDAERTGWPERCFPAREAE